MVMRDLLALARSIGIYRLRPSHQRGLRHLYATMIKPGDRVFDIGAHVGDRTACFKSLGAYVLAIEPQPVFAMFLRLTNALNQAVTIHSGVVSRATGTQTLHINSRNPTVSTLSTDFVQAANRDELNWQGQQWDRKITVQAFNLDGLIEQYGKPAFIKIDVEGAELDVLVGLSQPVPALSFEFTLIQRQLAHDCVERCLALGMTEFNVSLGESHKLSFDQWQNAKSLMNWIGQLPASANSGDIYARQPPGALPVYGH